jgi:acetyl esterase/lipase
MKTSKLHLRILLSGAVLAVLASAINAGDEGQPPTIKSFVYKKTKQTDLAIHIHFPLDWKKEDKRPAIVFFFGGGFKSGTVKAFEPQAAYFANRGMVTARADYRVKDRHGVEPDACVEDGKSAVLARSNEIALARKNARAGRRIPGVVGLSEGEADHQVGDRWRRLPAEAPARSAITTADLP